MRKLSAKKSYFWKLISSCKVTSGSLQRTSRKCCGNLSTTSNWQSSIETLTLWGNFLLWVANLSCDGWFFFCVCVQILNVHLILVSLIRRSVQWRKFLALLLRSYNSQDVHLCNPSENHHPQILQDSTKRLIWYILTDFDFKNFIISICCWISHCN